MNKRVKYTLKIFSWLAIGFFCLICFISKDSLFTDFSFHNLFSYASEAITISTIVAIVFEKWLWKIWPVGMVPVLKNRYSGEIISTWDHKTRKVDVVIRQSLFNIQVKMISDESTSDSIFATIDKINGSFVLLYCYINTPKAIVRENSDIHYGTVTLYIDDPLELKGQYYTSRKTTGDIEVSSTMTKQHI